MADYYTHVSFGVRLPREAMDWMIKVSDAIVEVEFRENGFVADDDAGFDEATLEVATLVYREGGESRHGCELEIMDEDKDEPWLWIHADDDGVRSIDTLAELLMETLKRWAIKEPVYFKWAETCSKPRLDAYGGGAVVVTAEDYEMLSIDQWIRDELEHIDAHPTLNIT